MCPTQVKSVGLHEIRLVDATPDWAVSAKVFLRCRGRAWRGWSTYEIELKLTYFNVHGFIHWLWFDFSQQVYDSLIHFYMNFPQHEWKKNSKLIEKTDFDINVSMTLLLKNIRTIRFPVLWILRHIKLGKIILKILHLSPSNDTQGQCPLQNRLKTRVYPGNCCV